MPRYWDRGQKMQGKRGKSSRKQRTRLCFGGFRYRSLLSLEVLEARNLLSAVPYEIPVPWDLGNEDPFVNEGGSGGAVSDLLKKAPFPLADTFKLHSNPTSTKTIYLDFNGHFTVDTPWNGDPDDPDNPGLLSIYTPPYSMDANLAFSDQELQAIQFIWERVSEDFRPFDVNVTTEEPPLDWLMKTGTGDTHWGQRVAIGGAGTDWYAEDGGVGGVAMRSFNDAIDNPTFAFSNSVGNGEKNVAEVISHEVGHTLGLGHDGEARPFVDPLEYYPGHGAGVTGWAPIMGVGYGQNVTQWSNGTYPYADNQQDDLMVITTTNGFDYRADDHGNDSTTATELGFDFANFFGEGIIERNTDVDFFTVYLGVESLVLNVNPFHRGPNLDVLVKLYDEDGVEVAMANPVDSLSATININNSAADSVELPSGVYYLSVEGVGRPQSTDFGYSDYASLGYYSIIGERSSFLSILVGVDFDIPGGMFPTNWTRYSGGSGAVALSDLRNEIGIVTPVNLAITSSKTSLPTTSSTINPSSLIVHPQPLDRLGGILTDTNVTFSFVWSDLKPLTVYEVFVFGLANQVGQNQVQIVGLDSTSFTQSLTPNNLVVNRDPGQNGKQLINYSETIAADETGRITITVANPSGRAGVAGMAIREGTNGSIRGQKWHDENGDGIKDEEEVGLEGWRIFIDDNNNGLWDEELVQTIASTNIPQVIPDGSPVPVKSTILFQGMREIFDVDVQVNITHNFNTDLDVFLVSPSGTRVELFTDVGSISDNFLNTILDDEATHIVDGVEVPRLIKDGTGPFEGRYRPEGLLSAFDGEDPTGIWTLEVYDDFLNNIGTLNGWSLTITGQEVFTFTDEMGNYSFGNLRPGNFRIAESLAEQEDWVQTFASPGPIRLTSGARIRDINFGNWQPEVLPGSIEGIKWEDTNGDGIKDANENGLGGWVIFLDVNGNGILDPPVIQTVSSEDLPVIEDPEDPDYLVNLYPKPIEDFQTVIGQLSFEGLTSVQDINVSLDITHSFAADLDVFLISPRGTQIKLFGGVGSQFNDFANTTFDDQATTWIFEADAPFNGSFRPEGQLAEFIGEDPNGIWQLLIRDTTFGDQGTLNSWSISIVAQETWTTTAADGSYSLGDLDPATYLVYESLQPGWEQTYPLIPFEAPYWEIVVPSNLAVPNVNFGNKFVGVSGDYNGDGIVNAVDYVVWRDSLGKSVAQGAGGDGSGNGTVGQEDYGVWRANYGSGSGSGSGAGEAMAFASAFSSEDDDEEVATPVSSSVGASTGLGVALARSAPTAPFGSKATGKHDSASGAAKAARSDSALLAWLASLPEAGTHSTSTVRGDLESAFWTISGEEGEEAAECELLDSAFAQLAG